MAALRIGVIEGTGIRFGLAETVRNMPEIDAVDLDPSSEVPEVMAIVVDAELDEREALLSSLAVTGTPCIVEMPVAASADGVERLERALPGRPVISINPLAYHLHTRRLLDLVHDEPDPVKAMFAAWRFRADRFQRGALTQLLDYIGRISTEPPLQISAMRRSSPDIILATIRFEDGIVAHIEFGTHLPQSFKAPSELTIEIFRRESVLHSDAFQQAIKVYGEESWSVDWAPEAAATALRENLDAIAEGAPRRGFAEDHAVLTVLEAIEWSAQRGTVAQL